MTWYYENKPVTTAPEEYAGFVYEIHDTLNQKRYIGKKLVWTTKKLPEREQIGNQHFQRKILIWCDNKNQMSYHETRLHFELEVLLKDEYYNGIISCRISSRGLR